MKSCQCHRLPAQLGYFELQKFMFAPTFRNRLLRRLGMGTPEIICRSLAGQFTTVLCLEVLQHLRVVEWVALIRFLFGMCYICVYVLLINNRFRFFIFEKAIVKRI